MARQSVQSESLKDGGGDMPLAALIEAVDREGDPRHAWARVRQHLDAVKSSGRTVPENLLRIERALAIECMSESQGR